MSARHFAVSMFMSKCSLLMHVVIPNDEMNSASSAIDLNIILPTIMFARTRYSDAGYNLACILTFPSSQRKGYGRFLISFSYELSKKEEKIGSPEKPLSDLGAVSYKSYWASTLLSILANFPGSSISVLELTRFTSILVEDVIATLHMLGLLVPGIY